MKRFSLLAVVLLLVAGAAIADQDADLPHVSVWDEAESVTVPWQPQLSRRAPAKRAPSVLSDSSNVRGEPLGVSADPARLSRLINSSVLHASNGDESRSPAANDPRPNMRGFRYSLTDRCEAKLSYKRSVLFGAATSDELRSRSGGVLSTDRDRDVLGVLMDWNVGQKSKFGVGYRLESARGDGSANSGRGLPSSEGTDHGLTVGITRSWGGVDD